LKIFGTKEFPTKVKPILDVYFNPKKLKQLESARKATFCKSSTVPKHLVGAVKIKIKEDIEKLKKEEEIKKNKAEMMKEVEETVN
jgi:hypothetical protein